jgi:hypothetical protein
MAPPNGRAWPRARSAHAAVDKNVDGTGNDPAVGRASTHAMRGPFFSFRAIAGT